MSHVLKERYQKEVVPALMKSLNLSNVMQVPRIEKVVVNIGVGEALDNAKALDAAVGDLTRSPAKSRSSPRRARALRTSSCAKGGPSASRLPCAASACGPSWTA